MSAQLPLVSIITPSFNQAKFILDTLGSVAAQDYPRVEHIIMDGGSTDGSVDIIRTWAETHPITWFSGPDGGQAAAIQRGIGLAKGDIIAWLNSDDTYLDPAAIGDVVAAFSVDTQMVTGGGWYLTEAGERLKRIPVFPRRVDHQTLKYVDWVLQPATFVRRDLLLSCPIDTSLHWAFDWDLFIRLTSKAPMTAVDREIAGYRIHRTGKTLSGGSQRQRELLTVIRRYHGRASRAYLLLLPFVWAHRLADRLPRGLGSKITFVLNKLARGTLQLRGGRGIPP